MNRANWAEARQRRFTRAKRRRSGWVARGRAAASARSGRRYRGWPTPAHRQPGVDCRHAVKPSCPRVIAAVRPQPPAAGRWQRPGGPCRPRKSGSILLTMQPARSPSSRVTRTLRDWNSWPTRSTPTTASTGWRACCTRPTSSLSPWERAGVRVPWRGTATLTTPPAESRRTIRSSMASPSTATTIRTSSSRPTTQASPTRTTSTTRAAIGSCPATRPRGGLAWSPSWACRRHFAGGYVSRRPSASKTRGFLRVARANRSNRRIAVQVAPGDAVAGEVLAQAVGIVGHRFGEP